MHPSDPPLHRIASAARLAPLPGDLQPPPGFASRVLAALPPESSACQWERFGWRSVAFASLVLGACLWWDRSSSAPPEDDLFVSQLSAALFLP